MWVRGRSLQLAFCGCGPPSGRWNVHSEPKDQLHRRDVRDHMIRFVHKAKSDTKKGRLSCAAHRSGQTALMIVRPSQIE